MLYVCAPTVCAKASFTQGSVVSEWMKERDFKDADVAERVEGLSRSQVNRIRRRKSVPPLQTARKLAVLTGLPVETFVLVDRAA